MSDFEKTENLAEALALLQQRLPRIEKSQTAKVETKTGHYSYTYADLSQISQQILPLLGALGLSFIAKPTFVDGNRFVLAYKLLHVSGQSEAGEYPLPTGGTPQALGSAITYGRRYCLCAVTGIAPEDDDDASAAQAEAGANRGTAQRARAATKSAAAKPAEPGKTAQRSRAASAPPPLPGEQTNPDAIPKPMMGRMQALFGEAGITEPQAKRDYCTQVLGRDITSVGEMTKTDAAKVIEALTPTDEPPDDPEGEAWLASQDPDGAP